MARPKLYDILIIIGLAGIAAGLYLAWPPLALIVCGGLLFAMGIAGARQDREGD